MLAWLRESVWPWLIVMAFLFGVVLSLPDTSHAQSTEPALSWSDIQTARTAPISRGGKEMLTTTWGTTPSALFVADVASTVRSTRVFQNIRVTNRHVSQALCVFDVAWSGATSCNALCAAASSRTCTGAATDGAPIMAGGVYTETWDGSACLCAVASAAATMATSERVLRSPL